MTTAATRSITSLAFVVLLALAWHGFAVPSAAGERKPAVAGQFYPANAARLRLAVDTLLADALPPRPERPIALVVPHAGYVFSGQIAADAFRQAAGYEYDTVVILGPNHTVPAFGRAAVFSGAAFRTPLGSAPVDVDLGSALLKESGDAVRDDRPHAREHAIEVLVPFVQRVFPSARLLPIVVGTADPRIATRVGEALARVLAGRRVLIVASSDLSHYPSEVEADRLDRQLLRAITTLDPDATSRALAASADGAVVTRACGGSPILAAMAAATSLGATRATVISYANSAHVAVGDPARVVGYGAIAFTTGAAPSDASALELPPAERVSPPLTDRDKEALIAFARKTITRLLDSETLPLMRAAPPAFQRRQAAFVSLKKRGQLRGCVGTINGDAPLARLVPALAVGAALHDPRFEPLRARELDQVDIEISLLGELTPVSSPDQIVPGRDGVVLRDGTHVGVFLPEVAAQESWNTVQLLDNLCVKAGVAPGRWRRGATLATFRTELIRESEFRRAATAQPQ